jgi:hypothetical protein
MVQLVFYLTIFMAMILGTLAIFDSDTEYGMKENFGLRGSYYTHYHRILQTTLHPPPPDGRFDQLLLNSKSDKRFMHGYQRFYKSLLAPLEKKKGLRMLEIGVEHGRSTQLWEKYFIHADKLYGIGYGVTNFQKVPKEEYGEKTVCI